MYHHGGVLRGKMFNKKGKRRSTIQHISYAMGRNSPIVEHHKASQSLGVDDKMNK